MQFQSKSIPDISAIDQVDGTATVSAATTDAAVIAAQGSGYSLALTDLTVANHGTVATVRCDIRAGTTRIWSTALIGNTTATVNFSTPVLVGDNTALNAYLSGAAETYYVSANGFKVKV